MSSLLVERLFHRTFWSLLKVLRFACKENRKAGIPFTPNAMRSYLSSGFLLRTFQAGDLVERHASIPSPLLLIRNLVILKLPTCLTAREHRDCGQQPHPSQASPSWSLGGDELRKLLRPVRVSGDCFQAGVGDGLTWHSLTDKKDFHVIAGGQLFSFLLPKVNNASLCSCGC